MEINTPSLLRNKIHSKYVNEKKPDNIEISPGIDNKK